MIVLVLCCMVLCVGLELGGKTKKIVLDGQE